MTSGFPRASVIIPAHNEAPVLGACLGELLRDAVPGEFEVVVVCNGCTDESAAVAARAGVRVIEISRPSKTAALNAGDRIAETFPRIYLDADVSISTSTLRTVAQALDRGGLAAARSAGGGSPWFVPAGPRLLRDLDAFGLHD